MDIGKLCKFEMKFEVELVEFVQLGYGYFNFICWFFFLSV